MGLRQINNDNKEINNAQLDEKSYLTYLKQIIRFTSIDRRIVRRYIETNNGLRPSNALLILIGISVLNCPTRGYMTLYLGVNMRTVNKAVDQLLVMGYITERLKPRLVVPFGAYVLNNGYLISDKGILALRNILS